MKNKWLTIYKQIIILRLYKLSSLEIRKKNLKKFIYKNLKKIILKKIEKLYIKN